MIQVEPAETEWPAINANAVADWVGRTRHGELALELSRIKEREQRFLRRELHRVDEYFENYARELRERMDRQHKEEAMRRYADRLEATLIEHNRRRTDQIERHTIHVVPHIDAFLTVAKPACGVQGSCKAGRD